MINSVNLNSESLHKNLILSSKQMTETKTKLPPQNKKFVNFTSIKGVVGGEGGVGVGVGVSQMNQAANDMTLNELQKGMHAANIRLQYNGWNYENFCRLYTNNNNTYNNNNNNNNNNNQNNFNNKNIINADGNLAKVSDAQVSKKANLRIENACKRTQDQENAIRRIEDVHNYAKLKHTYSSGSGESSRSSPHVEEEDDDDEEDEVVAAEDSTDTVDLEQKDKNLSTDITLMSHLKYIKKYRLLKRQQEEDMHIDVETVPQEEELHNNVNLNNLKKDNETSTLEAELAPDHHARRPMNAFLIFCKRHRAIVKDRYKTLENRAITKILGDWWASLETNDKECFTNLAQENKDAFFSANPNFKWYKLPAPPLRSLRGNSSDNMSEYQSVSNEAYNGDDSQNNYFKLADETQMGDLSALLTHNEKRKQKHSVIKTDHAAALQQALGETTLFLNKHIHSQPVKRSYVDSNNGIEMEDNVLPKKTSRTCKGKKYQELMQSGQIAASAKKTKIILPKQPLQQQQQQLQLQQQHPTQVCDDDYQQVMQQQQESTQQQQQHLENSKVFDLEEKIKELPALSLDLYLQRKRNVKKKRKINAKKSNSSQVNTTATTTTTTNKKVSLILENKNNSNEIQECNNLVRSPAAATAAAAAVVVVVGSQKRKARKESITRRDVSSLEHELTAVLPNNIKGNFYFDDTTVNGFSSARNANVANSIIFNNEILNNYNKSAIPPPTSDLLILAEVAEKTSCY